MGWLEAFKNRHLTGYAPSGLCLGCRNGWHSIREHGKISDNCKGRRYANSCPDYADPTPTYEEYLRDYGECLRRIFDADIELRRIRAYGSAKKRREFLKGRGAREKELRAIEESVAGFAAGEGQRLLKKLRSEL